MGVPTSPTPIWRSRLAGLFTGQWRGVFAMKYFKDYKEAIIAINYDYTF